MVEDILVEKYRPVSVKDICGQEHIKKYLNLFVEKKSIPHLLLYGRAGIGKTSTALALGKDILGSTFGVNFLELNASDERGIEVVREKIKYFAKLMPIQADFKIILLDECDALTSQAQNALRRIMEKSSKTCRFILCCNSISAMIDPIISRCVPYNFVPLKSEDIGGRLKYICEKENLTFEEEAISYLADASNGDIRRAIMRLQTVSSAGMVNMENIYNDKMDGSFLFIIKALYQDKNWQAARQGVIQYQLEGGEARELILRLHDYGIKQDKIVPRHLLSELSRIFRVAERDFILGVNPQLNLDALLFDILDLLKIKTE